MYAIAQLIIFQNSTLPLLIANHLLHLKLQCYLENCNFNLEYTTCSNMTKIYLILSETKNSHPSNTVVGFIFLIWEYSKITMKYIHSFYILQLVLRKKTYSTPCVYHGKILYLWDTFRLSNGLYRRDSEVKFILNLFCHFLGNWKISCCQINKHVNLSTFGNIDTFLMNVHVY